jgi:hypothetical protein
MSRSGYSDDCDQWQLIKWRGQVKSAMRGKRGQKFFRDLIAALDALDEKRLVSSTLKDHEGEVCALGALCGYREIDLGPSEDVFDFDAEWTANRLDIAVQLAQETAYENDEGTWKETPEERWSRMRRWAENNLLARPEAAK